MASRLVLGTVQNRVGGLRPGRAFGSKPWTPVPNDAPGENAEARARTTLTRGGKPQSVIRSERRQLQPSLRRRLPGGTLVHPIFDHLLVGVFVCVDSPVALDQLVSVEGLPRPEIAAQIRDVQRAHPSHRLFLFAWLDLSNPTAVAESGFRFCDTWEIVAGGMVPKVWRVSFAVCRNHGSAHCWRFPSGTGPGIRPESHGEEVSGWAWRRGLRAL